MTSYLCDCIETLWPESENGSVTYNRVNAVDSIFEIWPPRVRGIYPAPSRKKRSKTFKRHFYFLLDFDMPASNANGWSDHTELARYIRPSSATKGQTTADEPLRLSSPEFSRSNDTNAFMNTVLSQKLTPSPSSLRKSNKSTSVVSVRRCLCQTGATWSVQCGSVRPYANTNTEHRGSLKNSPARSEPATSTRLRLAAEKLEIRPSNTSSTIAAISSSCNNSLKHLTTPYNIVVNLTLQLGSA